MEEQNTKIEAKHSPNIKIIIAAIIAVIIIAIVLHIVLASPIPKDYKVLSENLKNNSYEVKIHSDGANAANTAGALIGLHLAFGDQTIIEKGKEIFDKLQDTILNNQSFFENIDKAIDCGVFANYDSDSLWVLYFKDSNSANRFYSAYLPVFEFIQNNISHSGLDELKCKEIVFGQKGKIVYFGTKDALKASK